MNSVVSSHGKPGVYAGVAGTDRSTSLCNLALIFSRDKTPVCPAHRGMCVAMCAFDFVWKRKLSFWETVPTITGQTELASIGRCNHKHSYTSHLLQTRYGWFSQIYATALHWGTYNSLQYCQQPVEGIRL